MERRGQQLALEDGETINRIHRLCQVLDESLRILSSLFAHLESELDALSSRLALGVVDVQVLFAVLLFEAYAIFLDPSEEIDLLRKDGTQSSEFVYTRQICAD